MEEGLNRFIREKFGIPQRDIRTYSPLTLAYVGDAVYELVIRSLLTGKGNAQVSRLHKRASALVNAGAQAESLERIRGERRFASVGELRAQIVRDRDEILKRINENNQ